MLNLFSQGRGHSEFRARFARAGDFLVRWTLSVWETGTRFTGSETFTIITTRANGLIDPIDDRASVFSTNEGQKIG
jgi:putative SOS response-associated peptidase YedK